MGNRAVITTEEKRLGIYLHWNGGRDSVEAFLAVCKEIGYPPPESDHYGWPRLCQIIGNFFGGKTNIGIDTLDNLDCNNLDNGMYIIRDWEIIEREHFTGTEQRHYDPDTMIRDVKAAQPATLFKP